MIRKVLIAAVLFFLLSTFSPATQCHLPFHFMEDTTKLHCIQSILSVQKPGKAKENINKTTLVQYGIEIPIWNQNST